MIIDSVTANPFLIWAVPLLFYLADNVVAIRVDELILEEDVVLSWKFRLSAAPYQLLGRDIYILNCLAPHAGAVRLAFSSQREMREMIESVRRQRNSGEHKQRRGSEYLQHVWIFRIVSLAGFLNLFLLAPMSTIVLGFSVSIKIVLMYHFILVGVGGCVLSKAWPACSRITLVGQIIEYLVCPGYLANFCKRSAWRQKFDREGTGCWLARLSGQQRQSLANIINEREEGFGDTVAGS